MQTYYRQDPQNLKENYIEACIKNKDEEILEIQKSLKTTGGKSNTWSPETPYQKTKPQKSRKIQNFKNLGHKSAGKSA
ncbi:hypothetical protein [Helicobacter mustelae]|uniref:hypothetical protein n=1 Tax=Helicobacter mustelae TaxID=217 RepID=UPI0002D5A130|nr:hypothetical protein [Helicobacter mustelae]